MWPQWWVMNTIVSKAWNFKQQQSCATVLLWFGYLQCALCPVLHGQNLLQSLPLSSTDRDGSVVSARLLCSTRLWANWPCFPLPPDSRLTSPLQRPRGITEEQCTSCAEAESSGNGKSRLSPCAPELQYRIKGLWEQQFFLLPQGHQIGREAVWKPIDHLFRQFNSVRNVAIPFLLFELKSWKNEMLFCSERSPSSVILSDGFFVGFFFGVCVCGDATISLVCVYWVYNKFTFLKYCFVKPLEIITTAMDTYSLLAHQH